MPFDGRVLRAVREKRGMKRTAFSAMLGLSYGGLYKYEDGTREPKYADAEKIALMLDMPVDAFYNGGKDGSDIPNKTLDLLELSGRLHKERAGKQSKERRIAELERENEHIASLLELQTRHAEILRMNLTNAGRSKKLANLARETAKNGDISFDEISETLMVGRPTLRRWFALEINVYHCQLFAEKTVEAFMPREAGIRLQCFDCESKAAGDCKGYGNTASPEDFFAAIALFESNGINDREEQADLLRETYNMELSAHLISEYISRGKNGKPIPPNVINLQPYKHK